MELLHPYNRMTFMGPVNYRNKNETNFRHIWTFKRHFEVDEVPLNYSFKVYLPDSLNLGIKGT